MNDATKERLEQLRAKYSNASQKCGDTFKALQVARKANERANRQFDAIRLEILELEDEEKDGK